MEFIPQLVVTVAWNGAQWMQCRTARKIILWWSHQKTLSVVSIVWHVLLFFHLLIDSKIISTSCTQSTQFIIFHNNYTYAIAGTSLRSAHKWRHWSLTISCHSIDHWDQYDTRLEDMIKIWTVHDKLISMTRSNMKWTRTWGKYDGNKHNMILCFFWSNLLILLLHLAAVPYIEYIFTVTFPQRYGHVENWFHLPLNLQGVSAVVSLEPFPVHCKWVYELGKVLSGWEDHWLFACLACNKGYTRCSLWWYHSL